MQPITPKQFLALGFKTWREIHWTIRPTAEMLKGYIAYPVGFPGKDGTIIPFGLWCVPA